MVLSGAAGVWLHAVTSQHARVKPVPSGQLISARGIDCRAQGIDMLIKEFGYHIAYKRWNDSFTAVPFKPK